MVSIENRYIELLTFLVGHKGNNEGLDIWIDYDADSKNIKIITEKIDGSKPNCWQRRLDWVYYMDVTSCTSFDFNYDHKEIF